MPRMGEVETGGGQVRDRGTPKQRSGNWCMNLSHQMVAIFLFKRPTLEQKKGDTLWLVVEKRSGEGRAAVGLFFLPTHKQLDKQPKEWESHSCLGLGLCGMRGSMAGQGHCLSPDGRAMANGSMDPPFGKESRAEGY